MWTVVYMAQSKDAADSMQSLLEKNGLITKLRDLDKNSGDEPSCYELLVPESEVEQAHSLIIEASF